MEKHPFDGSTGGTPRAYHGLAAGMKPDTLMDMRADLISAATRQPK